MRPLNEKEMRSREQIVWKVKQHCHLTIKNREIDNLYECNKINTNTKTDYFFDYCFSEKEDNRMVYQNVVKRVALSSLNGINGTVFMYG